MVDDEPDLVVTLDYNLRKQGYATRTAANGAEALLAAQTQPLPDLILLDLMLPDMSGKEICRTIRANETTQAIPIVMLTAKGEEIDRVVGFEVGADDYVVKPFSVRELMLRVQAVLRRSENSRAAESSEVLVVGTLSIDAEAHIVLVEDK
ncbi:MAG: response regulator, partial [Kofleriaceae bacterium]|nr:response regulator [Kofleriaceae bacterium]